MVRGLTEGEKALLLSVFASQLDYEATHVFGRKWQFFQPDNTAMTPNGNIYFPPAHYLANFSLRRPTRVCGATARAPSTIHRPTESPFRVFALRMSAPYEPPSQGDAMPFPLPFVPDLSFKTSGRKFGASRDNGKRSHAGCDLIAKLGTEIYAIEDGIVYEQSADFYHGTNAMVVRHQSGIYVRYCEILKEKEVLTKGTMVKAGDVIAKVGKMLVDSMLHFELYSGQASGPFTQRGNGPFQRRSDLSDPTLLLERLARELVGTTAELARK